LWWKQDGSSTMSSLLIHIKPAVALAWVKGHRVLGGSGMMRECVRD
jgi:hypothetical protein